MRQLHRLLMIDSKISDGDIFPTGMSDFPFGEFTIRHDRTILGPRPICLRTIGERVDI